MNDMNKLEKELQKEIEFLDRMINEIEHGGWSTIHLKDLKRRRDEIKTTLYDYRNS